MTATQTDVESKVVGLSAEAFNAFCKDISGMFKLKIQCDRQEAASETAKGFKKRFKKLVAVNTVQAEGVLKGTFQLVFDQEGLFTLSGVVVMMPEQRILEEIKGGSIKDVEAMNDAIKEMGNMLVGAWDRVFREGLKGHGHFLQSHAFIGNPWDEPEKTIDLASGEECVFVPYNITIGSYPTFNCGVIFPKTIFNNTSKSDTGKSSSDEQAKSEQAKAGRETKQEAGKEAKKESKKESEVPADKKVEKPVEEESQKQKPAEENTSDKGAVEQEPQATAEKGSVDIDTDVFDKALDENEVVPSDGNQQPVSKTAVNAIESPSVPPGRSAHIFLTISAKEIMEKDVVWSNEDDSVAQALTKMQQHNAGYIMIESKGMLGGIVSKSDITGAISPYLRPIFAKWRRPLDDATLQIRVKWIMTSPVHTISPDTSLAVVMESMCRFSLRAFPVVDRQGKVQGLVTVFNVFQALLSSNPNMSTVGKVAQAPPLA